MLATNTILQVPVDKTLRDRAAKAASDLGFSSLQEAVRVFLVQLPTKTVKISFEHPPVQISTKAARRYDKIVDEIESGKMPTKAFEDDDSIEVIMEHLNS